MLSRCLAVVLAISVIVILASGDANAITVEISIPQGTSSPGCEATNSCFQPYSPSISVGDEVMWTNHDTAAHTVTSGTMEDSESIGAVFDSSLFIAGKTFSYKFEEAGEFPYFCMVHPWMQGTVIVQAHEEEVPEKGAEDVHEDGAEEVHAVAMTSDGAWTVSVHSDVPTAGEELALEVEFTDAEGNSDHTNYQITATQDYVEVLSEEGHAHPGELGTHTTAALTSDSPVDVQVTILGFGLPTDDPETWTGPIGETVSVTVSSLSISAPPTDSDGDGILDTNDQCDDLKEDFDGYYDKDGCPEENPPQDSDGIPDSTDSCPTSNEDFDGYQDTDGCPEEGPSGLGPEIYAIIAAVIIVPIVIVIARRKKKDDGGQTATRPKEYQPPSPPKEKEPDYSLDDSKLK